MAEPFHVDFNGRLTMGVLGNHLLNCAGFHANDRGFGIATLNEDNYTWVLSRLAIELDEMPTACLRTVILLLLIRMGRRLATHVLYGQ